MAGCRCNGCLVLHWLIKIFKIKYRCKHMREQSVQYSIMQQVLPYPRELGGGGGGVRGGFTKAYKIQIR